MSKKIIIIAALVVAVIAALPLVGNMGVKKIIDARIVMLESNGLKVESSDNGSSYLQTKSHYEFTLEDSAAFENYLTTLSEAQVPSYMRAMLDDVVMAADVSYSNMVVSSDVSLDLYPVAFTKEAGERMKAEDALLYAQMIEMLKNRAFMYHMDYDVAGTSFKGYIKDIDKEIRFKDGKKAKIIFESATFDGKGTLVEPESVMLKVKKADVDFSRAENAKMKLSMRDLVSNSTFSAKNSFDLDYEAKSLYFYFKDSQSEIEIEAKEMKTISDSKVLNGKLSTAVNASIKHFKLHDKEGSVTLQDFVFVMDADNIDEAAYEAFQKASEQAGTSSQHTMLASLGVVAKGFDLHIDELSVAKIAIKDSVLMDGFNHKVNITVKADDNLIQKVQTNPMALMENINVDAKLNFATAFYSYIKEQGANLAMADAFAKQDGENTVFDILLKDGKITVNGQSL